MTCPCEGKNPQNLRELVKCVEPILFHKVTRPASLGDDTDTPATELQYKNVLLTYEANNHSYLYSSDGVPTFISLGDVDTAALEAAIKELQGDIASEALARHDTDKKLQAQINSNFIDIVGIRASVAEETAARQAEVETLTNQLNDLGDKQVQTDTTMSADASTVTLTKSTGPLNGNPIDTGLPLPVASSDQAGVMNASTFTAVQENSENIDSILNGAILIESLPAEPTQEELTQQWEAVTGKTTLINRASIYDKTNGKIWYYYTNVNEWEPADIQNPEITVSVATNDSLGIVKGSNDVFVEPDGSLSVVGLDGIHHDIDNLAELVAGIDVPKVSNYVIGSPQANRLLRTSIATENPDAMRELTFGYVNTQTGSVNYGVLQIPNATISPTTGLGVSGFMSGTDKARFDSMLEIKSLNDSLSLSEDGELSVVGGGSDVNLLSAYTAEPTEGDAYDASYMNDRLDSTTIYIGKQTSVPSKMKSTAAIVGANNTVSLKVGSSDFYGVVLGRNNSISSTTSTVINSYDMAIGNYATINTTQGLDSIAIGKRATVGGSINNARYGGIAIGGNGVDFNNSAYGAFTVVTGVAVGCHANVNHRHSVAIGSDSKTSREKEFSIGGGIGTGYAGPPTRYLANVTAGELPTDAVNLQQMQDYVAEHAGGGSSNLEEYTLSGKTLEQLFYALPTAESIVLRGNVTQLSDAEAGANVALTTLPAASTTKAGLLLPTEKAQLATMPELTEMQWTRVSNLPPAVVTGFEDTTYGTDTITMHLDTKDLATGGVSVQELMLEGATANTDTEGGHAGLMTAFQATQLAALAEGGAGGLTSAEVTKVQNLGSGSLTNMDGVLQTEEAVEIEFSRQNLVAGGSTTQTATIAAATTEEAGVMTPTMVAQLNQIGDIATVLETLTTGTGV